MTVGLFDFFLVWIFDCTSWISFHFLFEVLILVFGFFCPFLRNNVVKWNWMGWNIGELNKMGKNKGELNEMEWNIGELNGIWWNIVECNALLQFFSISSRSFGFFPRFFSFWQQISLFFCFLRLKKFWKFLF